MTVGIRQFFFASFLSYNCPIRLLSVGFTEFLYILFVRTLCLLYMLILISRNPGACGRSL